MDAPYTCKFCGADSYIEPHDQTPPADYCHPQDHGDRDDWLAHQAEAEQAEKDAMADWDGNDHALEVRGMRHGQGR